MPLPLRCEPPHVSDEAMLLFNAPACRLSAFEVWNTCDGGGESTLHMHAEVFLAGGFPLFPFFGEKTAEFQNFLSNYIVGNEALLLKVTHNSLLRQTVSAKLKLKWFVMGGGGGCWGFRWIRVGRWRQQTSVSTGQQPWLQSQRASRERGG